MMRIKLFITCFMLASIAFSLLFIPTKLSIPITRFKPAIAFNLRKTNSSYPVTFAYLISASQGDVPKLKRLLKALYHPGNYYLVHMESGAPASERQEVAKFVSRDPVFGVVGNVWVVGKPNLVTYRGPTMLGTTLHAMAMLLRTCRWDWFINLSASDYPLVTQDDLMQAFSEVPKDVNFIQHASRLGWKFNKRAKPIIIDPGLYSSNKSELWWVIKQRTLPTAFKLYTGSAWMVLSRSFSEYSIAGWENLPRTLLLYYANFVSSPEGYFQTLVCNSEDYKNTTANNDLHYITWDTPPKQHPRSLGLRDYRKMVLSNRPFARKFKQDDPVLSKIDRELLKKRRGEFAYGGWCSGTTNGGKPRRTCSNLQSMDYGLRPGLGARRLKTLLSRVLSVRNFNKRQCK
ncbi:beta-glucuronosyltransferase GlcAT14A [Rhodamnia argentea]|uniref:Beta-glucuronosyltransferase GlcAT14A n=1 Tax=Rhodamnia argentea TaxID=178133 RepID=A0A8B8N334_9MYRT|nr:beta-glucuronosyltransferase GlcAT14A [Rhodamnia argentea]